MSVLPLLFWLSVIGLLYIYVGYPVAVSRLARRRSHVVLKSYQPRTVSVVLAAHNESANIIRKLDSLLAMDHADTICEIFVGSDGSTDSTHALVNNHGDPRVRLVAFAERRGKPAVLNDLVPRCTGEIVLFADVRQEFDCRCLTELVSNFDDPTIGVVSGELVLRLPRSTTAAAEGIGLYWKYEKWIRKSESGFRGVPGATGACYAIRRELFRPIANNTILDDVAIPMRIVTQGFRCVFEPAALAFDDPSQSAQQESIRKRRTIAGAAQLVRLYPGWLLPSCNPIWWEYVSHKLLRLVSPLLLALALSANLALVAHPLYRVLLSAHLSCYAAALCGGLYQYRGRRSELFGPALMFVTLNLTTLGALWDAVRSRYQVAWQKTAS